MTKTIVFVVCAVAACTLWCCSENKPQHKSSAVKSPEGPAIGSPQSQPAPVAPEEQKPPVSVAGNRKKPGTFKSRPVIAGAGVTPVGLAESPASKLAAQIGPLTIAERIEWTKREFKKRGIQDVHDNQ